MIQDATNQQIKNIQALFPLAGKTVLEVGCGKGRVTRDLAKSAALVIAADPDTSAIKAARQKLASQNVEFIHSSEGIPPLPELSIDVVIYTLSLHHVPSDQMQASLLKAGTLLKPGGTILILEPADGGTFNEAKSRFKAGSGDEELLKNAAFQAIRTLPGWSLTEKHNFMTEFWFDGEDDFFSNKLPRFGAAPYQQQQEIRAFLQQHDHNGKIILTAERCLYRLQPR